ncbi:MAG: MFS transporter [Caulobacterales bacterium]
MTRDPPAALRRGQRLMLGLLLLAGVTNYVDRVALSVANPLIRADLHLSVGQMGVLLSAFLWAYALAQLPVGALVDRLGPRRLLAGALVLWSGAQAAAGAAGGLGAFAAARMALGIGEAPQFPVGARVVAAWFAPKDRGFATGVFNSASTIGPAIAPPLVTLLMLSLGWRAAFGLMGAAGLVVAAVWWTLYRDRRATSPEGGDAPAPETLTLAVWERLFAAPTLWGMILGNFGSGYMNWFYAAWLPGYLEIERHVSVPKTGWLAAVPYVFGVFGSLIGGWTCDALARRGLAPIASRKLPIVGGLIAGAAFTALAIIAPENRSAIACVCAAVFASNFAGAAIWALALAAAPHRAVASVGGAQNFGGLMGGALAPIVTGFTVQATHSFASALAITAAIGVGGALTYLFGVRHPIADPG